MPRNRSIPLSLNEIVAMMEQYKNGVSPSVLAKKYRVSTWTVNDLRKRLKIPPQRNRRVFRKTDEAELERARNALDAR